MSAKDDHRQVVSICSCLPIKPFMQLLHTHLQKTEDKVVELQKKLTAAKERAKTQLIIRDYKEQGLLPALPP